MIDFEDAQRRILGACTPLGTENVALGAASGRVLAETLRAGADLVPFARSAMDGFAVRAADTALAPTMLRVEGVLYAQAGEPVAHVAGTATQIATGAPIPAGADAVLPVEDVVRENGGIRIRRAVTPGAHVFPPGEDARAGDILAGAGAPLRPAVLGLLASAGHARLSVFRRPRVAVVVTGDELVDVENVPGPGQIRNSNAVVVRATVASLGGDVVAALRVGDDSSALGTALDAALGACDLLITTGGASVGERDLVKPLLRELGVAFAFESVALRPAKPTAFGTAGDVRVAVLPGNPSSAFVALHELVRLALARLAGMNDPLLPRIQALLAGSIRAKAQRTYAAYATVRTTPGGIVAAPLANQCSALTRTAADADGFIIVPPGRGDYASGDTVAVDVFDWSRVGTSARN